ncbi:MAG: ActS/PrrB/RegB family redox-sensitive histidine kinase [Sphingomonadales bacterium]
MALSDAESLARESGMRLHTLVLIRWIALAGQAIAVAVVRFGFGFPMPVVLAGAVVGLSAALNLRLATKYASVKRLTDREASLQLGLDMVQLAALLYLTGGLANPFAVLILAPVTISATNLTGRSTVRLALLATLLISLLGVFHLPLPWHGPFDLEPIYVLGVWAALVVGTVFMSIYAWRVAREARRMADALTATQFALAREQQLSAVGGLAAAAAHELGTPLSTIALAAKELHRGLSDDDAFVDDIELISTQAVRCRDILARLGRGSSQDPDCPYECLPFTAMIAEAGQPHGQSGVKVETVVRPSGEQKEPMVWRSPEIAHGLGNLIENAVGFARASVELVVAWDDAAVSVKILDDGPGFATSVLGSLGEPYVTTRGPVASGEVTRGSQGGLGLGVFIAKTLLQRTGARTEFANRAGRGAAVEVCWARSALEAAPSAVPGPNSRIAAHQANGPLRRPAEGEP